ncbi:putative karyogamy protein, KAR9 [Septoria linicola]|nr:putative karyogamy protein, KAR9 [Septoria linicola]
MAALDRHPPIALHESHTSSTASIAAEPGRDLASDLEAASTANRGRQQAGRQILEQEKRHRWLEIKSHRPGKRLSPGLEARLQRLQRSRSRESAASRRSSKSSIGRIPESQLGELERLHHEREREIEVRRRGTEWNRSSNMPIGGGVRLSGGPVLTDNEASELSAIESDANGNLDHDTRSAYASSAYASSIIDISDALVAGTTSDEDTGIDEHLRLEASLVDNHKYRMPDIGKTRLNTRTKQPLSPPRNPPAASASDAHAVPMAENREKPLPELPSTPSRTFSTDTIRANGHAVSPSPSGKLDFGNWQAGSGADTPLQRSDSNGSLHRPSLSRANSIYTLGRASFTGQLAQLTSMRLPDADSLAKRISALPSASDAAKALSDAYEQIRVWIAKAKDALEGLNAEDDVEWAAAGGREGIDDVDKAITRFQRLVEVYIESIERLQTRNDVHQLSAKDIQMSVEQMENVVDSWKQIKDTLKGIKQQVEVAMEWQDIWDRVLGDIAQEMEGLHRLVFEMEEKRHQGSDSVLSLKDSIDISELETIVEEQPGGNRMQQNRLSLTAPFMNGLPMTPPSQPAHIVDKEDSSLLALFARMQPLRANLDFMPMRLSSFAVRGNAIFPSACMDLDQRRDQLESQWQRLEADAESLRRELGEDRWVTVFRNAGRQALKMCESITRSFQKLKQGVDSHEQHVNPAAMQTKVDNYEQKKRHYGPAIERVLAIIDRGVTDRLTVNGEILRLQSDMKRRWTELQAEMKETDVTVADIKEDLANVERQDQHLRDSVSTVISTERSLASSLGVDTPGSSPASSVIVTSRKGSFGSRTPTPLTNIKLRNGGSKEPVSRLTLTPSSLPRRSLLPKKSLSDLQSSQRASSLPLGTPSRPSPAWPSRPEHTPSNKPRFSVAARNDDKGFAPLSAYEPSKYAKSPATPKFNYLRSGTYVPPVPALLRTPASASNSRTVSGPASSLPRPASSLAAASGRGRKSSLPIRAEATPSKLATPTTGRKSLTAKASAPNLRPGSRLASGRRSSMMPTREVAEDPVSGNEADSEAPSHHNRRPPSALAINGRQSQAGRRSSLMRSRLGEREASAGADGAFRPKWRP